MRTLLFVAAMAALPAAAQMQPARVDGTCDLTLSTSQETLSSFSAARALATGVRQLLHRQ